jgi:hypothetical protein
MVKSQIWTLASNPKNCAHSYTFLISKKKPQNFINFYGEQLKIKKKFCKNMKNLNFDNNREKRGFFGINDD